MIKLMIVSVGKIFGGIEKYTLDLLEGINRNEYEIHLVIREDGELVDKITDDINVLKVRMDKKHILHSMWMIKKYVKDKKIDIVQCNSNNALFAASMVKKKKKIAVIHGDVAYDQSAKGSVVVRLYEFLENRLLRNSGKVVAVSNSLRNKIIEKGINNISVVYNGINIWVYGEENDYMDTPMRIACVGNLLEVKNQIALLKAIQYISEEYPDDCVILDLYGEGPCYSTLKDYMVENSLADKVNLMGFQSDVRKRLVNYPLYVQPSKYESFGIAALEAMNAGCCVIASDVGGLKEIIDEGEGILFPVDNYVKLAEHIHFCYSNRSYMKCVAERGRQKAVTTFSIPSMLLRMDELYREVMDKL